MHTVVDSITGILKGICGNSIEQSNEKPKFPAQGAKIKKVCNIESRLMILRKPKCQGGAVTVYKTLFRRPNSPVVVKKDNYICSVSHKCRS